MKSPIIFTESAFAELKRLENLEENLNKFLRIGVKGGGCSGMTYVLEFDNKEEDDADYQYKEITFIMKKAHKIYLQDLEIHFGTGLEARGFEFKNPNASDTCGCGQSFAV